MGNTQERVVNSVDLIMGVLAGVDMLEALREGMLKQRVFRSMFGRGDTDEARGIAENSHIFVNEVASKDESKLPLMEIQFDNEVVEGADLRQRGFLTARVLFPNNLTAKYKVYRTVAMAISRWFASQKAVDDFLRKVPGLTECGENLEFTYDAVFKHGGLTCPALLIRIPFVIDLQRMRVEDGCTDLNADLDAKLLKEIESYFIEITDDEGTVLIEKSKLYPADQS